MASDVRAIVVAALVALATRAAVSQAPARLAARPAAIQRVDYAVAATLEPAARRLTAHARITYHNASPDTLRALYWHLYQNIFRADSRGHRAARALRPTTTTRGITVQRVSTNGIVLPLEIDGTIMRTALPQALAPGDSAVLEARWEYEVPDNADLRTGSEGADFALTQWYPQIAVYDQRAGWEY